MKKIKKAAVLEAICLLSLLLLPASCGSNNGLVDGDFTTKIQATTFYPTTGSVQGGVPVTIIGDNFMEGVRVFFGDVEATEVEVRGESTLVASLPPGDFGPIPVRVSSNGTIVVLPEPFRYRAEIIQFQFHEDLGMSGYDAAFATGDFNGDGRVDIVVASSCHLSLFLNSEDGYGFHSNYSIPCALNFAVPYENVSSLKYSLAVVDYNSDGLSDVVLSVLRSQTLYRFSGTAGSGLSGPIETAIPDLLDDFQNRFLDVADFNGDGESDLLVVNHSGDATSEPTVPEKAGTIGALLSFGTSRETVAVMDEENVCDSMHSYRINRNVAPHAIELICDRPGQGEERDLYAVDIAMYVDEIFAAVYSPVLPDIGDDVRFHLFDLDEDGTPEVFFLRPGDEPIGSGRSLFVGGMGRMNEDHNMELLSDFEFNCSNTPHVVAGNITGDSGQEIIALCPRDNLINVFSLDNEPDVNRWRFLEYGELQGPDYSMATADGRPLMPSVAVFDVDKDGRVEFLLPSRWGLTFLIYANDITYWYTDFPRFSAMPAIQDVQSGSRQFTKPYWNEKRYHSGAPVGMLVDLNNDGKDDHVKLYGDPGLAIRIAIADGKFGARREIGWQHYGEYGFPTGELLIEDLNADGHKDFIIPEIGNDYGTVIHVVLSGSGGYRVHGSYLLTQEKLQNTSLEMRDDGGVIRLVGLILEDQKGSLNFDLTSTYSVVAFEGTLSDGFSEVEPLVEDLEVSSYILEMVDIDRDGRLDLVTANGQFCLGHSIEDCHSDKIGFSPLFSTDMPTVTALGVFFSEKETSFEFVGINEATRKGEWVSVKDNDLKSRRFSLDLPAGGAFYYLNRGAACDIDGDGLDEILFYGVQQGQTASSIIGLFSSAAEKTVEWKTLGFPDFHVAEFACSSDFGTGTIDDLVVADWYDAIYWAPNRSW